MNAGTVSVRVYANDYVELTFIHKTSDSDHKEVMSRNVAISLAQRILETFRCPAESLPQPSGTKPEPSSLPAPTTQPLPDPST